LFIDKKSTNSKFTFFGSQKEVLFRSKVMIGRGVETGLPTTFLLLLLERETERFRKSLEESIKDCRVRYSDTVINAI
jgi:hypothetical protein